MGNEHPRIINCSGKNCQYAIGCNREKLNEQTTKVAANYAGAEVSVAVNQKFDSTFGENGWGRIQAGQIAAARCPDGDRGRGLYVSVWDLDGYIYAQGQPWNPKDGSYFNIVIGDDGAIHEGYKNK